MTQHRCRRGGIRAFGASAIGDTGQQFVPMLGILGLGGDREEIDYL